jgi:beta-phosphoglucomutase
LLAEVISPKISVMKYRAFLFDLNGTMINDMPYHIRAWYRILNELGAGISMERVKQECYGKNGELLERVFPNRFTEEEKNTISVEKEKQYQREFAPHLKLIKGLDSLLKRSHEAGITMAIGSAAILFNVNFVLDGLHLRDYFKVIVSAEDVNQSKPDPETYTRCIDLLHISPEKALVFEDAPKGVEAAQNAGIDCVVITTLHQREEFDNYGNVVAFIKDYNNFESLLLTPAK